MATTPFPQTENIMKLKSYMIAAVALMGLTACNEDFGDWTNQAGNKQEAAINFGNGKVTEVGVIDLAQYPKAPADTDSVKVCTIVAPTTTYKETTNLYFINLGDKEYAVSVTGNMLVKDLKAHVEKTFGLRPVERTVTTTVTAYTGDGKTAVKNTLVAQSGKFNVKVIPQAPFIDEKGYYIVGNVNSWSLMRDEAMHLTNGGADPYDVPEFTVDLKPVDGLETYEIKLAPASAFGADDKVSNWGNVLSSADSDPVAANSGTISTTNAGGNIKFAAVEGAKKYRIKVNVLNGTYEVTAMSNPELYLTGSNYSWGGTWLNLHPVNGNDDAFWRIIYLHKDEQIKFAPQAGWGNDFGAQYKMVDEAGANPSGTDNIVIGNAGWYLVYVNTKPTVKTVSFLKPTVYLIGNTAGEWNVNASHAFTTPTEENGEFVSPAFAADDDVRMCVSFDGYDWWRTEFILNAGGKIDFRENGGEQTRVKGVKGQRAYLNFTTLSGSYK